MDYEDIINLPHHVSKKHTRMSMMNRAAQFASFAALTGLDSAMNETARIIENDFTEIYKETPDECSVHDDTDGLQPQTSC